MWIPYFLLEFWEPETSLATVQASDADHDERQFEVWFILENPPTRRRDVELRLREAITKTQTDGAGRTVSIRFQAAEGQDLLGGVGFRIHDTSARAAFRYAYDQLGQLLSVWALSIGSGFSIFGLRIFDERHEARWKVLPQRAAPEDFFLPDEISLSPQHAAVISLYREARNAQSPFYRFLCCYKILEAWYRSGGLFRAADTLIRDRDLPFRRPRRTVTQDMLVLSMVFSAHPEFRDATFRRFFELLNPWRIRVAHAVTDAGDFVNLDTYAAQTDMGPIANLTDMVARQILIDELDLWRRDSGGDRRRPSVEVRSSGYATRTTPRRVGSAPIGQSPSGTPPISDHPPVQQRRVVPHGRKSQQRRAGLGSSRS